MRAFWRLLGIWAVLAALLPNPAAAQLPGGGVSQQGSVSIGNCVKWVGNALIADAGGGCGGSGSPGGSTTQLQYNNAGSFGGISGATSNGTTITLVGPILGTPASATLTNATGLPISTGVSGLGAGIAAWLATPSSANLASALTDETGSGAAVFGTAPTISSLNATTALTLAFITGSTQCLHVNTSGVLSGTGSDCGSGGSSTITAGTTVTSGITTGHFLGASSNLVVDQTAVTSVAAGCGTSTGGSPITTTGTVSAALTLRSNTAASDTIVAGDCGNAVYENRATSVAVAIAQAGTTGFAAGAFFQVCNINAGVATITPTTSTIGGASTLPIPPGTAAAPVCYAFQSDGANYNIVQTPIFNVSGTSALGTGAITSAACATAVTTTATGVATTDTIQWGFNGDPTAVTGYVPLVAGMLTIIAYPSSGNVNFKVCNNTSSSVTPGAITLNWRVVR